MVAAAHEIRSTAARRVTQPVPALDWQRVRIVDAMVLCVAERGFARTTVGGVCARASVSRSTFYGVFAGLEECFLAVIDDGYRCAHELIGAAFDGEECWQDGVRRALASLLAALDERPRLARVWFVETLAVGSWALEHRARCAVALTEMLSERWPSPAGAAANPLAAMGAVELVMGIVHRRILADCEDPLLELLGPLCGLIVAIYGARGAAVGEIERGEVASRALLAARAPRSSPGSARAAVDLPSLLRDPRAHRARDCIDYLAGRPGASNRQIATAVGIARKEQISKLLNRLHELGLLIKRAAPPGGANAWWLSRDGEHVAEALRRESGRAREMPVTGSDACQDD